MKKVAGRGDESAWRNFGVARTWNALEMVAAQRTRLANSAAPREKFQ